MNEPIYIFIHLPKNGGTTLIQNLKQTWGSEAVISANVVDTLSDRCKARVRFIASHEVAYGVHEQFPGREPRYLLLIRDPAQRRVSQYHHDVAMMDSPVDFWTWYRAQMRNEQVFLLARKWRGVSGRKTPRLSDGLTDGLHRKVLARSAQLKLWAFRALKLFRMRRNPIAEFEDARRFLKAAYFVGLTERLDEDLALLGREVFKVEINWTQWRVARETGALDADHREVRKLFSPSVSELQRIRDDNSIEMEMYEEAVRENLGFRTDFEQSFPCAEPAS